LQTLKRVLKAGIFLIVLTDLVGLLIFFPWSTDQQGTEVKKAEEFYKKAYAEAQQKSQTPAQGQMEPISAKEQYYIDYARGQAVKYGVPGLINSFVKDHGLADKKVLEIGAGSGFLQDIVSDYTALDISPTARRFFHKPFVEASATDMPFPDNSFDAIWTVWVLEHIPNPEKALLEMRRVVKPGGYLYLLPALEVSMYAPQGYRVRPYSDLSMSGKLIKATVPPGEFLEKLTKKQIRFLRSAGSRIPPGPSRLHFRSLTPNFEQYWEADSDAFVSLSRHELFLWFKSRGDKCLNCSAESRLIWSDPPDSLIIQVNK
jgi:ubiquinone/menaquinone biosynthesis C-methylase UbiE